MLLAIDIGNTNISFGVFRGNRVIKRFDIPTRDYSIQKPRILLNKLKIQDCLICSVVPPATMKLKKDLRRILGGGPYIIGKDIIVPIKNLYRKPKEVGQDRLVNAYAGVAFYGSPLIIIDFGTAVTFDVVSGEKEYLGGMILPGLGISLSALAERTALLPKVKLARPKEFIARDTRSSILSGVVYGFAALTDDLSKRIKEKIGRAALVIGTGGNIGLISKYCQGLDRVDRDLTLKGLNLIYNNIRGNRRDVFSQRKTAIRLDM